MDKGRILAWHRNFTIYCTDIEQKLGQRKCTNPRNTHVRSYCVYANCPRRAEVEALATRVECQYFEDFKCNERLNDRDLCLVIAAKLRRNCVHNAITLDVREIAGHCARCKHKILRVGDAWKHYNPYMNFVGQNCPSCHFMCSEPEPTDGQDRVPC